MLDLGHATNGVVETIPIASVTGVIRVESKGAADKLTLDYSNTMEDGPVDYYEISELNTSYVAFKDVAADCSARYGDCGGIRYELVRLPDPAPGDESCGC